MKMRLVESDWMPAVELEDRGHIITFPARSLLSRNKGYPGKTRTNSIVYRGDYPWEPGERFRTFKKVEWINVKFQIEHPMNVPFKNMHTRHWEEGIPLHRYWNGRIIGWKQAFINYCEDLTEILQNGLLEQDRIDCNSGYFPHNIQGLTEEEHRAKTALERRMAYAAA